MKTAISTASEFQKSVGNPVVIIDMATGVVVQGVLSGISELGINRQIFYSVHQNPEAVASMNVKYTRTGKDAKIILETKLNADTV